MASKPAPKKVRRHKETVPAKEYNKTPSGAKKRGGKQ
jgi:hypothetical protein